MSTLKDHTSTNVNEMQRRFVEQSEHFKRILSEEKEAFESYLSRMNTAFGEQISRMPAMGRQLEEISAIPARLDRLIERIDKSNQQMVIQIARAFHDNQQHANKGSQLMITTESEGAFTMANGMPEWVKWTGFGSLVVIALACLFNIIVYFIPRGAV